MKKLFPLFLLFISTHSFAQQTYPCSVLPPTFWCGDYVNLDTFNLFTGNGTVWTDTANQCNVWQRGMNAKPVFGNHEGWVTDTSQSYPANANCILNFKFPTGYVTYSILIFEHNFETDSLLDGGYLELSCDNGITWNNANQFGIQISSGIYINYHNYPSFSQGNVPHIHDTIAAFTGNSNGWQWSAIQILWYIPVKNSTATNICSIFNMDTLNVRFVFESDSIDTGKAGWMIRNLVFGGGMLSGIADSKEQNQGIKIFPNPASSIFKAEIPADAGTMQEWKIKDISGRILLTGKKESHFDVSALPAGIYLFECNTDKNVFRQRMMKE